MQQLKTLIDKAAKVCGSKAALAQRLGVHPPDVAAMANGRRPISPETAAELADIAGEDVDQAIRDALIERNRGTRREHVLREILGKALAAGVAGMWVFSYNAGSIDATAQQVTSDQKVATLYIVLSRARGWLKGIKRLLVGPRDPRGAWGVVPPPPRP